jgi:hypothetical protein
MITNLEMYRIAVDFTPKDGVRYCNGSNEIKEDDYVTSMYAEAESASSAIEKFKIYILSRSSSYEFVTRPVVVTGIHDYPMDGRIIRLRNEEGELLGGKVVFGWMT